MNLANPWKSYRQIAAQTAPPGTLVLMLYDGALRFLERALTGFDKDDPAECNFTIHDNVQRAQEIVRELNGSLNMAQGGDVAANLHRLYNYFERRLHESNLHKHRDGIEEVIGRLTVLRDAWSQMLANQREEPPRVMPQLAVA